MTMPETFDAVLVLSFGGPETRDDVIPFLENVLRGRNVPRERLLEVAEHYYHFGGRSPINDQNRELVAALARELEERGPRLPVYWGNRNWHPLLADTVRQMAADGIRRALVYVTSAFGSYSGCRQYLEDLDRARGEVGPAGPQLEKLRTFHDHPGFIKVIAERVRDAFAQIPEARRAAARLMFTAHSIPVSMSNGSPYVAQIQEACALVATALGREWSLAYQSRSGPPSQPWLGPDIGEALRTFRGESGENADVVVSPIGFVSDHMEVLYDLDTEAQALAKDLGVNLVRAGTPGTHPRFIAMIRDLIEERVAGGPANVCAPECCPAPARQAVRPSQPLPSATSQPR
jgi:ferrochelatase